MTQPETVHAQLAAALRKLMQAAERELWARHRAEDCGQRDPCLKRLAELNAAVIVTKAACDEVSDLIVSLYRTKTVSP